MLRCLLGMLLVVAISPLAWADDPPPPEYHKPVLIRVEGTIDSWLEHYVLRKLARAKDVGCDLLILEINSPGGGLHETLNLCDKITELSGVHTVAYIPNQALSGAAILSLACDDIVMGEFGKIGDCGPIYLAEDFMFRHADEKVRSHLVAEVRGLCDQNRHPPALAEAMVDRDVSVLRMRTPDGVEQLLTNREVQGRADVAAWEKIETLPEAGGNRFFEVAGRRAKELGLASAMVDGREQLYKHYDLKQPPLVLESDTIDTTAYILNMWIVTALLLIVGLVGLAFELSSPGTCVGGVIAALCFILFFWSRFLGGTSGWLEVVLFASGLIFLAVELFVIPGFGITGITGIGLMLIGVVLASQSFTLPSSNAELQRMSAATLTTTISGIGCLIVCALMVRHMHALPVLNRLMLQPPSAPAIADETTKDGKPWPPQEQPVLLGDWGVATTLLRPGGKAQFGDRLLDVVADGAFIQAGVNVKVIELQGNRIVVEAVS
jgi:membrane-bound serine protease (ClpP class)